MFFYIHSVIYIYNVMSTIKILHNFLLNIINITEDSHTALGFGAWAASSSEDDEEDDESESESARGFRTAVAGRTSFLGGA